MNTQIIVATRVVVRALAPTLNKAAATALNVYKLKQEQKAFTQMLEAQKRANDEASKPQEPIRVKCERVD